MRWSRGYSASYYMTVVDAATWRDIQKIQITGGDINRSKSELMQSADIDCVRYDQQIERWVRVWMDTRQDGAAAHVALFTGLATSPDKDITGNLTTNAVECYSVLKPAQDIYLDRGWYVPAGADGAEIVAQLLAVTPAPKVVSDGSPTLSDSIIAEDNENHLSMANKILEAIGWRLRIEGDGTINIMPEATEASATLDCLQNDVIETELTISRDWFSAPNVYRATSGDLTAVARDESINSPLSVVNRGREVWKTAQNVSLAADESIAQYAQRMLKAAQRVQKTASYDRRFLPDVYPGDLVMLHYPAQGLDGLFEVESQSIELGHGARTTEKVGTYVTDAVEKTKTVGLVGLIDDEGDYLIDSDGNELVAFEEH